MVLFNIGKGLSDATCRTLGLPHMIVGTSVANSERIFSSGNERTPIFFNPPVCLDHGMFRFAEKELTKPPLVGEYHEYRISSLPGRSIRTYH
jgi:hypothetical protein